MGKFPTRTLVLMVLALLAFGWFYWRMHGTQPVSQPAPAPLQLEVIDGDGGQP